MINTVPIWSNLQITKTGLSYFNPIEIGSVKLDWFYAHDKLVWHLLYFFLAKYI